MNPVLLDRDPDSGATETFTFDEGTETAVIRHSCDVQPILDANREAANHGSIDRSGEDDLDLRLVARVPNAIILKWFADHGIRGWLREDWPGVKRMLNSNEYRWLRVNSMVI